MTEDRDTPAYGRLRSTLAYLEREAARRAKGGHPGMIRLDTDELDAIMAVLRREVATAPSEVDGQ